jgi:hypothetical protein
MQHIIHDTEGSIGNAVQLPALSLHNIGGPGFGGTVHSGVRLGSDGMIYRQQTNGSWSAQGQWLLGGTNSTFYVSRVVNSGTLDTDGGTIQQLNANEDYGTETMLPVEKAASITLSIYDNGTETVQNGFPISRTYSLSAEIQDAG